jgi:hypothetical protein
MDGVLDVAHAEKPAGGDEQVLLQPTIPLVIGPERTDRRMY